MKQKTYVGVNIQSPISRLILSGDKTVETRTYPIPKSYVGKELLLVETPGSKRNFKTRAIAKIQFGESFKYKSRKQFYEDIERHRVNSDSPWAWDSDKGKWGWPILSVTPLAKPFLIGKRVGIVFTKGIEIA